MVHRNYRVLLAAVLIAGLLCGTAAAGTIRHDVDPQLYLNLAQDARYQGVGQVTLLAEDGVNYAASGVLIDSKWVLTAGHVVYDAVTLDFHVGGTTYAATQMIAHPKYGGGDFSYDIGLVELAAAVSGIDPAVRYTASNELGKVGTFVGYGMTGDGRTGATDFDGLKRAGQNMIDVGFVDTGGRKNWRVFGADFDSPISNTSAFGSSTPLDLEYLISFGDSGGGVFIEEGGATYLAGIHSFIVDQDRSGLWGDYGDYTGHVRVSAFNDWIDSVINPGGGGGNGGGQGGGKGRGKPTGLGDASVVPEPATVALLGLGALLALPLRRRRAKA